MDANLASGITDGIAFCNDLASSLPEETEKTGNFEFESVLKRLTTQSVVTQQLVQPEEISSLIALLNGLVSRSIEPTLDQLSSAIAFFVKASSGHRIRVMSEPMLFEM